MICLSVDADNIYIFSLAVLGINFVFSHYLSKIGLVNICFCVCSYIYYSILFSLHLLKINLFALVSCFCLDLLIFVFLLPLSVGIQRGLYLFYWISVFDGYFQIQLFTTYTVEYSNRIISIIYYFYSLAFVLYSEPLLLRVQLFDTMLSTNQNKEIHRSESYHSLQSNECLQIYSLVLLYQRLFLRFGDVLTTVSDCNQ